MPKIIEQSMDIPRAAGAFIAAFYERISETGYDYVPRVYRVSTMAIEGSSIQGTIEFLDPSGNWHKAQIWDLAISENDGKMLFEMAIDPIPDPEPVPCKIGRDNGADEASKESRAAALRRRFGLWLRSARMHAGLSQIEAAKRAGMKRSTAWSRYERGQSGIRPKKVIALAHAIGAPADVALSHAGYSATYVELLSAE